jgi:hypothetical protein
VSCELYPEAHGEREYHSEFVGYLNAYWLWDSQDRLWLYNSDTGRVFFWELSGNRIV